MAIVRFELRCGGFRRQRWLVGFSLALAAFPVSAQMPAPPALIDQLVANAEQYRATLPSLTADESISSEISYLSIFRRHADATGTFRVLRNPASNTLDESRQILVLNGKPVEPGEHASLPATLFGGFDHFQEMFFTPEHRLCYRFTLLPKPGPADSIQVAIAAAGAPSCDPGTRTVTALVLVDAATHQITHLERAFPDDVAQKSHLAPFASADFAPTKVGDDTFWLPTTVIGRILNGKLKGQFVAHYSNYHRYSASMKLLPGATEVNPSTTPPPSSTPP